MTPSPKPSAKPPKAKKGLPPRTSYLKRSGRPIPKVNVKAEAKRKTGYRKYLASAVWKRIRKAAIERAGNRCEGSRITLKDVFAGNILGGTFRCPKTTRLTVHHRTYARYGGSELPEDLQVLCHDCHNYVESLKPARRRVG